MLAQLEVIMSIYIFGRLFSIMWSLLCCSFKVLAALLYLAGRKDKINKAINNLISDISWVYLEL